MILEWSHEGEPLKPGQEPLLFKGVRGCAFDLPAGIYIPMVRAERPGSGDVSRFLDALPRDQRVVFPTVISPKLAEMLLRRGFFETTDDGHAVMVRLPERKP